MRVRRSLLNFGTVVLYTAVTTAVAITSTRLLQHWLGPKRFGASRVVLDAYGYLTLLELGLSGALGPLLARAMGTGDEAALRAAVSAGVRNYAWVVLATLSIGLAATPWVPWLVKDLTGPEAADFRTAWVVGLGSFLVLVLVPFRSMVEARQLGYVINLLLTGQSLLITAVALTLAYYEWGITGQSVALVAGAWAFNLTVTAVVARRRPGLIRAALATPPDRETRRALRGLSGPTLLINLSGRVSILTDNIVVGLLRGGVDVNSLYNTQRLASLGLTVLQGVGGAAWAGMAELHAQGLRETFNRRLIELSRLVAVLSVAGLGPVVAYNRAFIRLWLGLDGPDFTYAGDLIIVVAAVNVFLLAQQTLWAWCFSGTGNARYVAAPSVVAAVVNLSASVALTRRIGLVGPLLGTTLALTAVGMVALPWLLRRVFGTPLGPLARALAGPFVWGVVSASGLSWLTRRHEPAGWLGLAAEMGLAAAASLAFGAAVLLTPEDRALWRGRIEALRGRKADGR